MKLNDINGMLVSVYQDWDNLLINPNFIRKGNIVSWNNYQNIFFGEPVQIDEVKQAISSQQYSFQVIEDYAIIQIYYAFTSQNNLQGAKLAYYKITDQLEQSDEMGNYPLESDSSTVAWLRIDYQPTIQLSNELEQEATSVLHTKCHLQISGFYNARLPICGVPTPKQFIEFIVAFCYPSHYQKHRLDERGAYNDLNKIKQINETSFNYEAENIFGLITHLKIP